MVNCPRCNRHFSVARDVQKHVDVCKEKWDSDVPVVAQARKVGRAMLNLVTHNPFLGQRKLGEKAKEKKKLSLFKGRKKQGTGSESKSSVGAASSTITNPTPVPSSAAGTQVVLEVLEPNGSGTEVQDETLTANANDANTNDIKNDNTIDSDDDTDDDIDDEDEEEDEDGEGDEDGDAVLALEGDQEEWFQHLVDEAAGSGWDTVRSIDNESGSGYGVEEDVGDVVFLGAGPVGLWTAVQVKILRPSLTVRCVEKYPEYQRKHLVILSRESFKRCKMTKKKHPQYSEKLKQFVKETSGKVRTNVLEDRLTTLAKDVGVEIVYRNITDVQTIPAPRICLVGSDGRRSTIRQQCFADEHSIQMDLRYILMIKYDCTGKAVGMKKLDQWAALKVMKHKAAEHVGRLSVETNATPVTIMLFIHPEDFPAVRDATFKNPYTMQDSRLPLSVAESIRIYCNARTIMTDEKRVTASATVTAIPLGVYQSKAVYTRRAGDNTPTLLVGDAAFGVPFFRALNNGMLCGSELATTIASCADLPHKTGSISLEMDELFQKYEVYLRKLAKREIRRAAHKSDLLSVGRMLNNMAGKLPVPLQVYQWAFRQKELLTMQLLEHA